MIFNLIKFVHHSFIRFRIAEIRYQRVSSGKSHVESVILYLPDIWSCVPTANQWENIVLSYIRPIQQPADDEDATLTEAKAQLTLLIHNFSLFL